MCKTPIQIDDLDSCLGREGADARFGTFVTHSKQETRCNASLVFFLSKGARRLGFISFSVLFYRVTKSFKTYFNFFSIIILITQTYNTKNITITRYYLIFGVPGKKENSKVKQSKIEVKIIMKMKKRNLCSNWEIFFMSDTCRQTLIGICEVLFVKNLKEVHQIF